MSRLDHLYRRLLLTKFFVKGWGKPDNLKRIFEFRKIISDRERCRYLVPSDYPIHIDKERQEKECRVLEGHFESPFDQQLPGIMPEEVRTAKFEMILPKKWKTKHKPVCVHLAGTGDHHFGRRRVLLARPLLKEAGIASIILESPYYGVRKPAGQLRSSLHNVSDLFVMGGALVLESLALFHWCERNGFGPLAITGISMGGFMASLAATNWHKPLSLIPCLSWTTASSVFTEGVMSGAIPWKLLEHQYSSDNIYEDEITKMIVSPEDWRKNKAFQMGQDFARRYPSSVDKMKEIQENVQVDIAGKTQITENLTLNSSSYSRQTKENSGSSTTTQLGVHKPETVSNAMLSAGFTPAVNKEKSTTGTSGSWRDRLRLDKARSLLHVGSWMFSGTNRKENETLQKTAVNFMRGMMDECTHLGNFSCPVDPSLIIIVAAKRDAYVPRDSVLSLVDLWPGAEVRYLDSGHIAGFLLHQNVFRKAIIDALDRQTKMYYS